MKISKKTLLFISGMLSVSALGLMFVSAADNELFMDLNNAVQHIKQVKIILTGDNDISATLSNSGGLVRIDTNNFIIGTPGYGIHNYITSGSNYSTILGGDKNRIGGGKNVILGGSGNRVGGADNTAIGGEGNMINSGSCGSYNTIVGGKNNAIQGGPTNAGGKCDSVTDQADSSVIIGGQNNNLHGKFSVIMGNNSSVMGNNSVALGSGTNIDADNSFLWTESKHTETLQTNDVFVVMAQNGVIINTDTAHSFAKLTLGGPLILSGSGNQPEIKCGNNEGGGILKIEKSENGQLCLCSCDGSGWNSMFSRGACSRVCNPSTESPKCGTEVNRICPYRIMYSGSCQNGTVIEGTGAYFVDKNDIVHRSCQTPDGQVASCTGKVSQTIQDRQACMDQIGLCIGGGRWDSNGNGCGATVNCRDGYLFNEETQKCELIGTCKNKRGDYYAGDVGLFNEKLSKGFFFANYNYNWYMPLGENAANYGLKRQCVEREDFDPINDAHSCKFACAEHYDCGFYSEGDFGGYTLKSYATCVQEVRCYGDYTYLDGTVDKYGILVSDGARNGTVYKNPTIPLKQSETLNAFIYTGREELETIKENNTPGCYVFCDEDSHPVGKTSTGAGYYESVEGPGQKIRTNPAGYCVTNCLDLSVSSNAVDDYRGKGGWIIGAGMNRTDRTRHYTGYTNLQNIKNLSGTKENSCRWSCNRGTAIFVDKNRSTNVIKVTDESKGGVDITDIFFNDQSNQDPNNYIYQNAICREQCNSNYYRGKGRAHTCFKIPNGYAIDPNYYIEYDGIKNYTKIKRIECLNEGTIYDARTGTCKAPSITLETECSEKNNKNGIGNWFYREDGECKICPIGQYHTDNNGCQDCTSSDNPNCVKPQS